MTKKKIVIIGGGFAGSTVARKLEKDFEVTLIDSKSYFEFTPAILRTIVEPDHIKKVQVLHDHYLKYTKIIIDEVINISNKFVQTKNEKISYDYLVIASGSKYALPIKEQHIVLATRASHLKSSYNRLCKAKKVLIVGGGLVGIELAAEICTHYKDKEIILVHSRERLCERNSQKASNYIDKFFEKNNVKIIYNERVKDFKKNTAITEKGTNIQTDMLFLCTGIKPDFEFMQKNFSSSLNEKSQIKVNEYIQVLNRKNIFAPGDINDMDVEKTAQNAERQADITAQNIKALESNKELKKYEAKKTPMVISLGKSKGILESGSLTLTGFIPGLIKSYIEWKEMRKFRN